MSAMDAPHGWKDIRALNLKPSVTASTIRPGLAPPRGPQFPYAGSGYAPVFVGGVRGNAPAMSPALDFNAPLAPGTRAEHPNRQESAPPLRFDQLWSAHQNSALVWQSARGPQKQFQTTAPSRWPGPPGLLPRLFSPALGALGGVAQRGFHQDQSIRGGLYHLNPRWALRQLASVRTVSQTLNRGQNSVGIPGVFVPTSPGNFYLGRGTN